MMQIVRTILWVLLGVGLLLFALNNWTPVEVRIWQNLLLETKLAALAIGAFLLGLVPMWLLHRASRWRMARRIAHLEAALSPPPPPIATAEQLDMMTRADSPLQ